MFDVALVIATGAIGYLLRRFGYPVALMSQGSLSIVVERPVAVILLIAAATALLLPPLLQLGRWARSAPKRNPTRRI